MGSHPSLHHTINLRVEKEERIRIDKLELRFTGSENSFGNGFGNTLPDFAISEAGAYSSRPALPLLERVTYDHSPEVPASTFVPCLIVTGYSSG